MNRILINEIKKFANRDQEMRKKSLKFPNSKKFANDVTNQDLKNLRFVQMVLEKYGWPTLELVGKTNSHKFWILVQHADSNPTLQKKALTLLKKAVEKNQANVKDFAYLTDRVLMNYKKKQIYGTQFLIKNKKLVPYPIRSIKKLEQFRDSVGLNTLAQNKANLEKKYAGLLK